MTAPSLSPASEKFHRNLRGDIVFGFAVALGLYVAWLVRDVLVLIYVSALFAVVLMPVVERVRRLRIGRWQPGHGMAIAIISVALIGSVTIFLILTLPPLLRDAANFAKELPGRSPVMLHKVTRLPLLRRVDLSSLEARLVQDASQMAGSFVLSVRSWAGQLLDIIAGFVLTAYFLAEGDRVYRWAMSMVPAKRRGRLDETLRRAAVRMGRWLLGQLALMAILGLCSGIVFGLLRVRYAIALALLMGAFNIIPVVGAMISTGIAMLIALADSWTKVLGILIFELVYVQIENAYLTPRIMQSRVDIAGTAVFIALLLGISLAGIAGALVAVPSAVLIAVLLEEYVIKVNRLRESVEQVAQ